MSEKMKDSDETREEKFEERILKYAKPKRGKPMSEEMTNSWLVSQLMHAYLDCTNNQTNPNIFLDLKEKVVNRMDNELKLSDLVEAESIAREKMPIKVKWEVKEKNSMTTVPKWIIEAMLEFASPS